MTRVKGSTLILIAVDIVIVFLTLFATQIADFMSAVIPACGFAENGILCPSCGGTRCIRELGKGNFSGSFMYNPFVFIAVAYMFLNLFFANIGYLFNLKWAKTIFKATTHYSMLIVFAVCFAVFGIVRNFT